MKSRQITEKKKPPSYHTPTMHQSSDDIINDDFHTNQHKVGFISGSIFIVVILAYIALLVVIINIAASKYPEVRLIDIALSFFTASTIVVFSGLLLAREWARKAAVSYYIALKIYPLNRLIGN